MLVNPKETTYTVIFTTFAKKKCPKNWKNCLYELPTELPLFLEKILPCSDVPLLPMFGLSLVLGIQKRRRKIRTLEIFDILM